MRKYFNLSKKMIPVYITLGMALLIILYAKYQFVVLKQNNILIFTESEGILNNELVHMLNMCLILDIGLLAFAFLHKVILKIITIILLLAILFYSDFGYGFSSMVEDRYYTFFSPDQSHTLIVEESSFLLGGCSTIYEKTGEYTLTSLNRYISTDDGYRPFSGHNYSLTWGENSILIEYGYGGGGENDRRFETLNFASVETMNHPLIDKTNHIIRWIKRLMNGNGFNIDPHLWRS